MAIFPDDDNDDWKNTPVRSKPKSSKIPLDEAHECPLCLGKGFVHIVKEKAPRIKRRLKEDKPDASKI